MCFSGAVCLSKVRVTIMCFAWDNIIVVQFVQVHTMLTSMARVQQDLQEAVFTFKAKPLFEVCLKQRKQSLHVKGKKRKQ